MDEQPRRTIRSKRVRTRAQGSIEKRERTAAPRQQVRRLQGAGAGPSRATVEREEAREGLLLAGGGGGLAR